MSIVIGAETVEVVEGGHTVRQIPFAESARGYEGIMLSAVTAIRGHAREWTLRFPPMLIADCVSLEAELDGPGSVVVSGTLIDSANDVSCYATNIQRQTDDSLLWARVSCDLLEDDWTFDGYAYPEDLSNGRFGMTLTENTLYFDDLGSGTFECATTGTYSARVSKIGRFTPEVE